MGLVAIVCGVWMRGAQLCVCRENGSAQIERAGSGLPDQMPERSDQGCGRPAPPGPEQRLRHQFSHRSQAQSRCQIGRASCRERVEMSEGGESVKGKTVGGRWLYAW